MQYKHNMTDNNDILLLRQMVEDSVARKMKTPADFQFLTGIISERCKESLSVSTLKRVWGYVDGYDNTRYLTLSILARCVGFRDWEDFCKNHDHAEDTSNMVVGRAINPADLAVGDRLSISWAPDRRMLIEHLGDSSFKVLQSENSKLKAGDTFHCGYFIIGEPLYLDNFVHGTNAPTLFVVGNKGGLTAVRKTL